MNRYFPWRFCDATATQLRDWSRGIVGSLDQLYSPVIFGARDDFKCECGFIQGHESHGVKCEKCGVLVVANAKKNRLSSLGQIQLPIPCRHPVIKTRLIHEFPAAPLPYRISPKGEPNILGIKYERLLIDCDNLRKVLPPIGSLDYFKELPKADSGPIDRSLAQIVGTIKDTQAESLSIQSGCLLYLLVIKMMDLNEENEEMLWIMRSCYLTLKIETAL